MFTHSIQNRIRYAETDRMGYLYYGNYPTLYEIGRVEALRSIGISYKDLEDSGIALPVASLNIKYIKPIFYDELITIKTTIKDLPGIKINFDFELLNELGTLVNIGSATLVFFSIADKKPIHPPHNILEALKPYFLNE